jgi:hypothetical protein
MSSLAEWILEFRGMHEKARAGTLVGGDRTRYEQAREELARALIGAQKLMMKPGETPRQALRVARALQIDIDFGEGPQRCLTVDICRRGFAVLLARPPASADAVGFTLRMPIGEPLVARAKMMDFKKQTANVRAGFEIENLSKDDEERLELLVFDAALEKISI